MMDDEQITKETLENLQDQVLELMSATLKLNKQVKIKSTITARIAGASFIVKACATLEMK